MILNGLLILILQLSFVIPCLAMADTAQPDGFKVDVRKDGDLIVVDLIVNVPATVQQTWDVLTDFDHLPQFLSNLKSSKILQKNGDLWTVEQKGETKLAGFSFSFESLREVELKPYESLRSHLLKGTMKKHDSFTRLYATDAGTRITYHSESIPNFWVPPMLGNSVFEAEIRKQFQGVLPANLHEFS